MSEATRSGKTQHGTRANGLRAVVAALTTSCVASSACIPTSKAAESKTLCTHCLRVSLHDVAKEPETSLALVVVAAAVVVVVVVVIVASVVATVVIVVVVVVDDAGDRNTSAAWNSAATN